MFVGDRTQSFRMLVMIGLDKVLIDDDQEEEKACRMICLLSVDNFFVSDIISQLSYEESGARKYLGWS